MSALEALGAWLRQYPGLEELSLEGLSDREGAAFLELAGLKSPQRRYLDGSSQGSLEAILWLRRGFGAGESRRDTAAWGLEFGRWLEESTRQGALPALSAGFRPWSVTQQEPASTVFLQENGWAVHQISLEFVYFQENTQ